MAHQKPQFKINRRTFTKAAVVTCTAPLELTKGLETTLPNASNIFSLLDKISTLAANITVQQKAFIDRSYKDFPLSILDDPDHALTKMSAFVSEAEETTRRLAKMSAQLHTHMAEFNNTPLSINLQQRRKLRALFENEAAWVSKAFDHPDVTFCPIEHPKLTTEYYRRKFKLGFISNKTGFTDAHFVDCLEYELPALESQSTAISNAIESFKEHIGGFIKHKAQQDALDTHTATPEKQTPYLCADSLNAYTQMIRTHHGFRPSPEPPNDASIHRALEELSYF